MELLYNYTFIYAVVTGEHNGKHNKGHLTPTQETTKNEGLAFI